MTCRGGRIQLRHWHELPEHAAIDVQPQPLAVAALADGAEALAIIERDGIEALSLREVARRLGPE